MVNVIFRGRQTGRTTELIRLAAEAEQNKEVCYIVCHSQEEAHRIAKLAEEMKLFIGFPITYDEFLNREYHPGHISHLYIDNAEMLLQRISILPIRAITLLREDELPAS